MTFHQIKIFTYKIFVIFFLILLLSPTSLGIKNNENLQLTLVSKEILQNKNTTSYFLNLEPDNLGNLKIEVDVIDFNQTFDTIFSIIQKNGKSHQVGNNTIYNKFYPKLAYLYYSDKIFSMSSNTDISYNSSAIYAGNFSFKNGLEDLSIPMQQIDFLLPDEIKKNNLTNFRMVIFANDSNSKSNLKYYPFDYINILAIFDFPNNTNVNILIETPMELKSYVFKPFVYEENKDTGERNNISFKELYYGVHGITSTNKVNFEKNYTRIEIKISRNPFSIERLSFYGLFLFSFLICIYCRGHKNNKNLTEFVSLYLGLISVPLAIYLNNRPSMSFTIIDLFIIILIIITLLTLTLLTHFKKQENQNGQDKQD